MNHASQLLVVENELKDLNRVVESARAAGFTEIEARKSPRAARAFLEGRLKEQIKLPDGIILDLDFNYESGYELLRFWYITPQLRGVPVIVWTILGPEHQKMCELFKVKQFVGKWEGSDALQTALKSIAHTVN